MAATPAVSTGRPQAIPTAVTTRPAPSAQFSPEAPPHKPLPWKAGQGGEGSALTALGSPQSSSDLWQRVKSLVFSEPGPSGGGMASTDKQRLGQALLMGGLQALAHSNQPGSTFVSSLGHGGSTALNALQQFKAADTAQADKRFDQRYKMANLAATLQGTEAKLTQAAEQKRLDREARAQQARDTNETRRLIASMNQQGKGGKTQIDIDNAASDYIANLAKAHDPLSGQPFDMDEAKRQAAELFPESSLAKAMRGKTGQGRTPAQGGQPKQGDGQMVRFKSGQTLRKTAEGYEVPTAPTDPAQRQEGFIYQTERGVEIWRGNGWQGLD